METFVEKTKSLKDRTLDDCRILYSSESRRKKYRDGKVHFSWECDLGWYETISDLSYMLEALNVRFSKKYKLKIVAEQIKEKFADLRFYYSVEMIYPKMCGIFSTMFSSMNEFIAKRTDFGYKHIESKDGSRFTTVPTKHLFLHKLLRLTCWLSTHTYLSFLIRESKEQEIIRNYMDNEAGKLIDEYSKKCEKICEKCGKQLGNEWNPVCVTHGYFRIMCEKCADESGRIYEKAGRYYKSGKRVKDPRENG